MIGNEYSGDVSNLNTFATKLKADSNWISFTVDGYRVEAKVFADPSCFGINGGRISKMSISRKRETFYSYDRGEDIEPTNQEVSKILSLILDALR
jgi:hypothetical protein